MTKIVFLDTSTVDLGDINLSALKRLGDYKGYGITADTEVHQRARSANILIMNKVVITKSLMEKLPNLKLICIAATGVNNVDLEAAKKHKIAVTNVAGYSTITVAEHTLMFLLSLAHRQKENDRDSFNGTWSASPHFTWLENRFSDVYGKTLGILGYGQIGKRVAKLALAFGMKVIVARLPGRKYSKRANRYSLTEVAKKSDFISLHCALHKNTYHLINQEFLKSVKPTANLINMARGPVIEEKAVSQFLKTNKSAGYATDVLDLEPPEKNHLFFDNKIGDRVIITPHVAWASKESRQRLLDEIAMNISFYLKGERRNRVV